MKASDFKVIKMTAKGQILIPAGIRKRLGWDLDQYLLLRLQGDDILLSRLLPEKLKEADTGS